MGSFTAAISVDYLCRLCTNRKEDVIPIFGALGVDMNLAEKINNNLPMKVKTINEYELYCFSIITFNKKKSLGIPVRPSTKSIMFFLYR